AILYHPVLSMLNTKYIVINENIPPLVNHFALGNAWFVGEIIPANNANEEIAKLQTIDPAHQAVVSQEFLNAIQLAKTAGDLSGNTATDSTASIKLTSYAPNKLEYSYNSTSTQTALFSEVYYSPGWKATIDGQDAPIFRANWILRGLQLPAGKHNIVFTFEPESFSKGETYSRIASGVLMILLLGGLVVLFIKKRKKDGK
ncbi:MAG: YfhO family protein, partial [Bacteroidales bacterium]